MNIKQIKEAAALIEQRESALKSLAWAKDSTHFTVACGPGEKNIVPLFADRDAVDLSQNSYSGILAAALKQAVIRYREGHVKLIEEALTYLGADWS